jgi:PadR family transcriptional regulator PadR
MPTPDQLKGHLDGLLLALLEQRPCHGYDVVTVLREQSNGAFDLPEGTIYPALHRLERSGLIKGQWERGETRRRRVYHVTADGRRALAERRADWKVFSRGVGLVMGGA